MTGVEGDPDIVEGGVIGEFCPVTGVEGDPDTVEGGVVGEFCEATKVEADPDIVEDRDSCVPCEEAIAEVSVVDELVKEVAGVGSVVIESDSRFNVVLVNVINT